MKNYKLLIQYDGSLYFGWQIQNNQITVQEVIKKAVELLINEKVNLIGSGRTDKGVHALGQVANFRCEKTLDFRKFMYSLNSILPKDISVLEMEEVHENFHSRFDAISRSYIYLISDKKSPFYYKYTYYRYNLPEVSSLNRISSMFIGMHDFSSFTTKNKERENKICTVKKVKWTLLRKGLLLFYIEADRFLRGMVRSIVGTSLEFHKLSVPEEQILKIIEMKEREKAGPSAPVEGLFLYKIKYE